MNEGQQTFATVNATLGEAIAEVERECRVRQAVYPRLVASGKLSQPEADRRGRALACALWYLKNHGK